MLRAARREPRIGKADTLQVRREVIVKTIGVAIERRL